MSKKDKKRPKQAHPEPRSDAHAGAEAVMRVHDTAAMHADSETEIAERMRRRDSGASNPDKGYRHGATGRYIEGPSLPDLTHEVVVVDANDQAAKALRRPVPPAPNGPPPTDADASPASLLDSMSLREMTE